MSRAGEINRFHEVGFPGLLSLLPSRGSPAAAALLWWCRLGGGDPNNVPCPKRGATAVANAMAFFARMDTFVHWRGEGCGNNGGCNGGKLPVRALDGTMRVGRGRRRTR